MRLLADENEDRDFPQPRISMVLGQDLSIAAWTWKTFNRFPMYINKAIGIIENGSLVGSMIFSNYNLYNVEFSFYARNAMTAGIMRYAAAVALDELGVERVTMLIPRSRKRLGKQLLRMGAKVEGVLRCYYGRERRSENDAVQYVLPREMLVRYARPRHVRATLH